MIEEDEDEADSDSSESVRTEITSQYEALNNSKNMTDDDSVSLAQSRDSSSDIAIQRKNSGNLQSIVQQNLLDTEKS